MSNAIQKPVDPNKLELNRLRLQRLQLADSRRIIKSQVNTSAASRFAKLVNLNSTIASISSRINGIKNRLGIR